ncbi:MAG: tetratricopeptide repeat protein [Verrucomicrobia bacterium]|nr:tetratricopeptide repeat protein [Verrucomicrobiota bacterium]
MKKRALGLVPTWVWCVALVAGCLAPFAGRAFYIDDPLFLWTARQIRVAPAHFYDFNLNWSGLEMKMTDVMCNPPGMGFFLAAASALVGWGEFALHLACLLPAVAAGLGVLQLAKFFCSRPLLAVVLLVFSPAFLVCGTSCMCDVTMLAFWVWSLVFWERGLVSRCYSNFLWAAVMAGLCGLMKYSGLSVVPLLLVWALVRERRLGNWVFSLLIPVVMLGVYEGIAYWAHGVFLFGNAAAYAHEVRPTSLGDLPDRLVTGLVFAGACALPALALAPCLWSRRGLAAGAALLLVVLAGPRVFDWLQLAFLDHSFGMRALWNNAWLTWKGTWLLETQRALWLVGGLSVATLAVADWRRHRDAMSAVLGVWALGVLAFASLFNWTINGRSILPMLPAVGILLARRLEGVCSRPPDANTEIAGGLACVVGGSTSVAPAEGVGQTGTLRCPRFAACLSLVALGAFAVAVADYRLANSAREAAGLLAANYGGRHSTLWFQGHWGFQYYLQQKGAKPLDRLGSALFPGDIIVIPSSEADGDDLPVEATTLVQVLSFKPNSWLSTMDRRVGAGFHSDFWGPVPFALGSIQPELYYVFKVVRPFKYDSWAPVVQVDETGAVPDELAKLEARLQADPADMDLVFQVALLRMRQSQLPEAIAALGQILKVHPDDFRSHVQLGQLYGAVGDACAARDHYAAALHTMPDFAAGLNNLAWLLATSPNPDVRNGGEAVRLARHACALTLQKSPIALGTLAAAYAEAGRFSDAIRTGEKAKDLATNLNKSQLAERNRQLLELYRAGKSYHEPHPGSS